MPTDIRSRCRDEATLEGRGLTLSEDLSFQYRFWRVQRAGWAAMALILAAAVAGVFGRGVLADTVAGDPQGSFWVEYERFGQFETEARWRLHIRPADIGHDVGVRVPDSLRDHIQVSVIMPRPLGETAVPGGILYRFESSGPGKEIVITFYYKAERFGWLSGNVELVGAGAVPLGQFIYP